MSMRHRVSSRNKSFGHFAAKVGVLVLIGTVMFLAGAWWRVG